MTTATKLAPQAASWYNKPINIVVSERASNTTLTLIRLDWRPIMDTLYPHADNGNTPERRCSSCPEGQQWHPATLEFFPPEKKGKYGLSSKCRVCCRAKQKKHRSKPDKHAQYIAYMHEYRNRPEVIEQQRAYNRSAERRAYMRGYMRQRSRRPDVQEYYRAYNQRPDVRERVRKFYSTSEQKARKQLRSKAYNSRPEVQLRRRSYTEAYSRRPGVRERKQAWYHSRYALPETRARMSVIRHARRARIKNAQGTHTKEQVRAQYDRQRGRCYYCKKHVQWYAFHLDHVVPLSRGGSNDISNLVVSCQTCNLKKKDKLPHEFFRGGRLL